MVEETLKKFNFIMKVLGSIVQMLYFLTIDSNSHDILGMYGIKTMSGIVYHCVYSYSVF